MELHEKACPTCGGDCEGQIQAGWFVCLLCLRNWPRFMLRKAPGQGDQ